MPCELAVCSMHAQPECCCVCLHCRLHCDHAEAGKSMFHEEVARRREDRACAQTEAEGMRAQQRAQLAQQQSLLDRLSQREQQV